MVWAQSRFALPDRGGPRSDCLFASAGARIRALGLRAVDCRARRRWWSGRGRASRCRIAARRDPLGGFPRPDAAV